MKHTREHWQSKGRKLKLAGIKSAFIFYYFKGLIMVLNYRASKPSTAARSEFIFYAEIRSPDTGRIALCNRDDLSAFTWQGHKTLGQLGWCEKHNLTWDQAYKHAQDWLVAHVQNKPDTITGHRPPTPYEIRFGEGAIHYCELDRALWIKPDGAIKRWIKSPYDGLRYYR
jgi:hypothetical protein